MGVDQIEVLKAAVEESEMVLVGIGEEWETDFAEMERLEPYSAWLEEIREKKETEWLIPYLRAHYLKNSVDEEKAEAYRALGRLLEGKNYFIVSICMDGRMQKEKWKKERMVFPCGGYEKLQCAECDAELQDAEKTIAQTVESCRQLMGRLEEVKRPVCESCGAPLVFNQILSKHYNESGYLPAWGIYMKWLQGTLNRKVCVLELGVGMEFPSVIRFPFEKTAYFNQKSSFFRVHSRLYQMSAEIADRGVSIAQNPIVFLRNLFVHLR